MSFSSWWAEIDVFELGCVCREKDEDEAQRWRFMGFKGKEICWWDLTAKMAGEDDDMKQPFAKGLDMSFAAEAIVRIVSGEDDE